MSSYKTYTGGRKSSYYGGYYEDDYYDYYSSWGLHNYSYIKDKDDDADLVVKEPIGYDTPTKYEIENHSNLNWRNRNNDEAISLIKTLSRYFYHKMLNNTDIYEKQYADLSKLGEEEKHKFETISKIVEELENQDVIGHSPLAKACNVVNQFVAKNNPQSITAEMIKDSLEEGQIDFNDRLLHDPEFNELSEANDFSKKHQFMILDKISLMHKWGDKFTIKIDEDERRVPNSNTIKSKRMLNYAEINKVQMYQRMLPTFKYKLAIKDLNVNIPIQTERAKQKIIILVDYSGSMSETTKQQWVCAILLDRLKYAMIEECEIFFSYFVNDPKDLNFTHIYDKKSAIEFWSKFSTSPCGGDTYLGDMVNKINHDINEKEILHNLNINLKGEKVEILAINDGQLA